MLEYNPCRPNVSEIYQRSSQMLSRGIINRAHPALQLNNSEGYLLFCCHSHRPCLVGILGRSHPQPRSEVVAGCPLPIAVLLFEGWATTCPGNQCLVEGPSSTANQCYESTRVETNHQVIVVIRAFFSTRCRLHAETDPGGQAETYRVARSSEELDSIEPAVSIIISGLHYLSPIT